MSKSDILIRQALEIFNKALRSAKNRKSESVIRFTRVKVFQLAVGNVERCGENE